MPLWAVRLMMAFLRLLSYLWPGAMRFHAFAQVRFQVDTIVRRGMLVLPAHRHVALPGFRMGEPM